jgi:hypothetical protein
MAETATVSVLPMQLSGGRTDFFVSIQAGERVVTPHVFREEYKAAYHVALYDWLLNGGTEPDLMAFGPDDWPAVRRSAPISKRPAVGGWLDAANFVRSWEPKRDRHGRRELDCCECGNVARRQLQSDIADALICKGRGEA